MGNSVAGDASNDIATLDQLKSRLAKLGQRQRAGQLAISRSNSANSAEPTTATTSDVTFPASITFTKPPQQQEQCEQSAQSKSG
ncbi:hypothetical protein [Microcoleus sp. Z1_C3]|uniref:hypothetical protein n=1 Tax=unclassified Microcoleus TaxID=2642155 RepID=UPI002FD47DCE